MKDININALKVLLHFENELLEVGELQTFGKQIVFEYNDSFIANGLEISPFYLPLRTGLFQNKDQLFQGLPGVFNDSLPDGWGLLLMDRYFRTIGINPLTVSPLTRLGFIGERGMGALQYHPAHIIPEEDSPLKSLSELAAATKQILLGDSEDLLPQLFLLGGAPAGARPKVMVGFNKNTGQLISGTHEIPKTFHHYLIKFVAPNDHPASGSLEYAYALMAKKAGIEMPDCHLFETKNQESYFGVKRFDRDNEKRFHIHTLSGLVHADFRLPSLDYIDFLKVTSMLTKNSNDTLQAFRRMVFNIYAHNKDDHSKNFAFLLSEKGWQLAPAFDITHSIGMGGEHALSIAGIGKAPKTDDILRVAKAVDINSSAAREIMVEVKASINEWQEISDQAKVPSQLAKEVESTFHIQK